MSPPVWVILPSYQEAGDVERVVRAVLGALPGAHVLVVDSSPDGTGVIADAIALEAAWPVPALRFGRRRGADSGEPADLPIT